MFEGGSYLFLRLHGALQVRLDARLEVLDLLALEALQLAAHQAAHVVEQQPRLVDLALCVGDIGAELVEAVLLRAALTQELVLVGLSLLEASFPLNARASIRCILSDTIGIEPAEHRTKFPSIDQSTLRTD